MARVAQFGIALGALGVILTFMGLFPGVTGLEPTTGIGIIQIFTIITGLGLLLMGAAIYVKFTIYPYTRANLAQQIAVRLTLTGYIFLALTGLADIFGFGSHPQTAISDILLGPLQAAGMLSGFTVAAVGILLYAILGDLSGNGDDSTNGTET